MKVRSKFSWLSYVHWCFGVLENKAETKGMCSSFRGIRSINLCYFQIISVVLTVHISSLSKNKKRKVENDLLQSRRQTKNYVKIKSWTKSDNTNSESLFEEYLCIYLRMQLKHWIISYNEICNQGNKIKLTSLDEFCCCQKIIIVIEMLSFRRLRMNSWL